MRPGAAARWAASPMLAVSCVSEKVPLVRHRQTYDKALEGSVDENAEARRT